MGVGVGVGEGARNDRRTPHSKESSYFSGRVRLQIMGMRWGR